MLHIRTGLLIRNIRVVSEHCLQCLYSGVISGAILAASMILVVPLSASADEVLGRVTLGRKPATRQTLEFRRVDKADQGIPVTVTTNERGEYRIFLEPGEYKAKLDVPGAEQPLEQTVQSLAVRVQKDLKF